MLRGSFAMAVSPAADGTRAAPREPPAPVRAVLRAPPVHAPVPSALRCVGRRVVRAGDRTAR